MNTNAATLEIPAHTDHFPDVNHYAPKPMILASIVSGAEVVALCGESFQAEGCGDGDTASAEGIICPLCATIYTDLSKS